MKRKVASLLLIAVLLSTALFFTGCGGYYCGSCAMGCLRGCAASGLERYGNCSDCSSVLLNPFMGEDCTDACFVETCYVCGADVRIASHGENASCAGDPTEDLTRVGDGDTEVRFHAEPKGIDNLMDYYKVVLNVSVKTYHLDLKNVFVVFDYVDVNGNSDSRVVCYMARSLDGDKKESAEAEIELTLAYPEKGNRVGVHSDKYGITINNITVYAEVKDAT